MCTSRAGRERAASDVYVAGYTGSSAMYWKNGIAHALNHAPSDADARSIAIYEH